MSDKSGEKAVKRTPDTSSESTSSSSSDELAETRDDLEQMKLAKTEESEELKGAGKIGTGSPIRKTSSTEEPPESKPGTSRQQMQKTPAEDSRSADKNISSKCSEMQKSFSKDSEDSSSQKSIDYDKMQYRDVVQYFLRDESVPREMTPCGEGNTLSDISEICSQTASSSIEESVYHEALSSVKSEPSVSVYHDALESQKADSSDSTNLSGLPSLPSSTPSDITISTPTGEQGNAAYIARLEREARERSDPTSTSSGMGSRNISELGYMIDWMEEGERMNIPRTRKHGIPGHPEGFELQDFLIDRSSSESTSEERGHAAYLAELEKQARKLDNVESASLDTSSSEHSEVANIQKWMNVGKRMVKESSSSGSSLEQVSGDVEPSKSDKNREKSLLPGLSLKASDSSRLTSSVMKDDAAHVTGHEQRTRDQSEPPGSSSEIDSKERLEIDNIKKWRSAGENTASRRIPSKHEGIVVHEERINAHESSIPKAVKKIEYSKKDERSDSRISEDSSSSIEPLSTSTSEFSRSLKSSTESAEPERVSSYSSTEQIAAKPASRHKLQYGTIVHKESAEEENVTPFGTENPATDVESAIKYELSPERMEIGSPPEHDSGSKSIEKCDAANKYVEETISESSKTINLERTKLHKSEMPSTSRHGLESELTSEHSHTSLSKASVSEEKPDSKQSRDPSSSANPMSGATLEFSSGLKSTTESMELGEALKFPETKKSWQKSGSLRKLQQATISSIEYVEEEKVTQFGTETVTDAEPTKLKESEVPPKEMEVESPVKDESVSEGIEKNEDKSPNAQLDEMQITSSKPRHLLHAFVSETSGIKSERRNSSSSIEPMSTESSEFTRSLSSSIESMEPEGSSKFEGTGKPSQKADYRQKIQYATMVQIEIIEEENVTPFKIEETAIDVEPTTFKNPAPPPEQMEVSSTSPKAMEYDSPEEAQLPEIETIQSKSEHTLKNKPESKELHATLPEVSDIKEERSDSRLSSSSEPVSTSSSEFSHCLGSSMESTESEETSTSRGTRKSSPKPVSQQRVQYATVVSIETIEEETVTTFGLGLGLILDVETTPKDSGMSPEQMEIGSPVEQEFIPEGTKKNSSNKDVAAGEHLSRNGKAVPEPCTLVTTTPISSGIKDSLAMAPHVKSGKQPSRREAKQASASCESKTQIGKRCSRKAKLDKEKKFQHSESPKKRARRLSSSSLSESTGKLSGSGTDSESDYSEGN